MRLAFCLAVALSFCSGSLAVAQSWTQQLFPTTSHDFGTVAKAAKTEFRFPIQNRSQQEIHISSVRASCGCTTPIIETETIKPGQVGYILARFNTGTFLGARSATLTVTIDRPRFAEVQLKVKGYIRSDVVFNPGEAQFGGVEQGQAKQITVDLDYAGRSDWALTGVKSPDAFVSVEHKEVSRAAGRVKYQLNLTLKEDAPVGFLQNELVLQTNDRRLTSVAMKYSADVKPLLSVSPQNIVLSQGDIAEQIQKRLVVRSGKPFRITSIESEAFDIAFEPSDEPKETHLLPITLTAKEGAKTAGETKVMVRTDLPGEPEVSFTVVLTAEESK